MSICSLLHYTGRLCHRQQSEHLSWWENSDIVTSQLIITQHCIDATVALVNEMTHIRQSFTLLSKLSMGSWRKMIRLPTRHLAHLWYIYTTLSISVAICTHAKHLQSFCENPRHHPVNIILVVHQHNYMFFASVFLIRFLLVNKSAIKPRPPLTKERELYRHII